MKFSCRLTAVLLFGCSMLHGTALAHHSYAATYFLDQSIEIKGSLRQFLFRNPHSFLEVTAPDKEGVMQEWTVEWGSGVLLANTNVTADTLKPGDELKITGAPGRDPSKHRIRVNSIERLSDHWKWSGTFG
jgi:hypothetical protein